MSTTPEPWNPTPPPIYPATPPPPPPVYYAPPRATNGLAVASMILGILWIYWIGSILALIFGYIATTQIRQRNESGYGMAVAGIVLGWIGVATLVIALIVLAAAAG